MCWFYTLAFFFFSLVIELLRWHIRRWVIGPRRNFIRNLFFFLWNVVNYGSYAPKTIKWLGPQKRFDNTTWNRCTSFVRVKPTYERIRNRFRQFSRDLENLEMLAKIKISRSCAMLTKRNVVRPYYTTQFCTRFSIIKACYYRDIDFSLNRPLQYNYRAICTRWNAIQMHVAVRNGLLYS